MEDKKPLMVGGQAVLEGVMMRGAGKVATAVRVADGHIETDVSDVNSIADRFPILKKPSPSPVRMPSERNCFSAGKRGAWTSSHMRTVASP